MRKYTKEHEWVEVEIDEAIVGITEHAAKELGDITFVELPSIGTDMIVGDVLGVIESVKAASDIYCPISGTVCATNAAVIDDPSIVNRSAEKDGWLCRLENADIAEIEDLMDKKQYEEYLKKETK